MQWGAGSQIWSLNDKEINYQADNYHGDHMGSLAWLAYTLAIFNLFLSCEATFIRNILWAGTSKNNNNY